MKKLNLIFAALGLVFLLNACAMEENIQPQTDQQKLEKFTVKDDGEGGTVKPYIPPKD